MFATQSRRRNLGPSILLEICPVILRILRKAAIEIKARPHGAGLAETRGVVIDVPRRYARWVEAEAVVEMLDVNLLPALGEEFWKIILLLESEMPHARRVFEAGLVRCRAGEGAFAPHYGASVVWVLGCVGVGDHAANVLPDYVDW